LEKGKAALALAGGDTGFYIYTQHGSFGEFRYHVVQVILGVDQTADARDRRRFAKRVFRHPCSELEGFPRTHR
jgi:hypothetical protein